MSPSRRAPWALVGILVLTLAGCVQDTGSRVTGGSDACVTSEESSTGGERRVELQISNHQDVPTCVRVLLNGQLVAAVERAAQHPELESNPTLAATVAWPDAEARVRVEDAATGKTVEERVDVPRDAWIVVRVYASEVQVTSHAERPVYE